MAEFRSALLAAVLTEDLVGIARALVARAKDGDAFAAREILDRLIGKPLEAEMEARLTEVEAVASRVLQRPPADAA